MSYLAPQFDPDIFVSYSHGVPRAGKAPLRDWTQALIRRLKDHIRSLETEFDGLRLWMDPDIDPTVYLTPDLKAKANACGVLMIVMSKRYLESSWCKDELTWFKQQVQDRVGANGRIFVLRAQATDTSLWPGFLCDERGQGLMGFSFFDPETGYPWDFPDLREPNAEFGKELVRLQLWLIKRLRELRARAAKSSNADVVVPPNPIGPRLIYLHAPPDSDLARAEIEQALKPEGITPITPAISAGRGLADWQREAKSMRFEAARRCEALALLRLDGGNRFVGDLLDIGVDERERIAAARGMAMPCAVLDKTGEDLPFDVEPFGIERFDVNRTDWNGRFRSWLDGARRPSEEGTH
jgi:hypothetical protein